MKIHSMLKPDQEKYLLTIPTDINVVIKPYDRKFKILADEIIYSVHRINPDLEVLFMGAAGLGISGQGDLDLYILSNPGDFGKYLPQLKELFGEPIKVKTTYVAWEFERDNTPIELYLADPGDYIYNISMKEQINVFNLLKNDPGLLSEYEEMKISLNGRSLREYQKRKYQFYNRILADVRVHQDEQARISGERHAGIVIKDKRLLLIHRIKNGREYYVFPGGHRRKDEEGFQTVAREVSEETAILVSNPKLVFQFVDYNFSNSNFYYLCEWKSGIDPHLTGEESEADPKMDLYDPMWVGLAEIDNLNVLPKCAKYWLLDYLEKNVAK